jgi:hypothetical protein
MNNGDLMNLLHLFSLVTVFSLVIGPANAMDTSKAQPPRSEIEQMALDAELLRWSTILFNPAAVKDLIQKGANVNKKYHLGNTLLTTLTSRLSAFSGPNNEKDIAKLLEILQILLQAGANPTIGGRLNKTPVDAVLDVWHHNYPFLPTFFRLLVLYGGEPSLKSFAVQETPTNAYSRALNSVFPQPLLQAIILRDLGQVKDLLESGYSHEVIKDSDGVSALAYAAGQGNEAILSLLFKHEAYQYDTRGIEQAIEIVTSKLRGFAPESPDYKKYQHTLKGLQDQLAYVLNQQRDLLLKALVQHDPDFDLSRVPEEILQQIMKGTLPIQGQTSGK